MKPRVLLAAFLGLAGASNHAATFTVATTEDSGPGSLWQAILDANANSGRPDTIVFQIPFTGLHTITPLSALPPITDPVVVDGTTQPGFANTPVIELNGSRAGSNPGLRLLAGSTTIRGLVINGFGAEGIRIEGPGANLVQGNFIGTDVTGGVGRGNATNGVTIYASWTNVIGGTSVMDRNLISGNGEAGVFLLYGGSNTVQGNP